MDGFDGGKVLFCNFRCRSLVEITFRAGLNEKSGKNDKLL